jgi:hypothetical protein
VKELSRVTSASARYRTGRRRQAAPLTLECSRCARQESTDQNDLEVEYMPSIRASCAIAKHVPHRWFGKFRRRASTRSADQKRLRYPPLIQHMHPAPASNPENKRKHRRTKVDFAARIRRPGFEDDEVVCENMSRGGIRFKSSRVYFADATI